MGLRAVKITDKMLMATLIKCAVIEIAVCIGYSVLHELFGGSILYYNHDELRVEDKCNDHPFTGYVSMGSYAYFFVMLCALTKYSYGTRRALSVFKESTCAYFSSFLSLLCTVIVLVFSMATPDPTFRTAVQSFAIILVVSAVLALFYGTRIYSFFAEPENRNVTDMKNTTSTSNTGFSNSVMKQPDNQYLYIVSRFLFFVLFLWALFALFFFCEKEINLLLLFKFNATIKRKRETI